MQKHTFNPLPRHSYMENFESYYKCSRNEMIPLLPEKYSKVLEIGCGTGVFRGNLELNNQYWGIEPVKAMASLASKSLDKVLVGLYNDVADELPNDFFDLIICNDVIEHMVDHDAFLQCIKKKLAPNGCLVVSVPNVRYIFNLYEILIKKDWKYKDAGILDKTHLRFFTEKSLCRSINNNGFFIEKFMGINPAVQQVGFRNVIFYLCLLILGKDIKYVQMGVRIKAVS